VGLQMFAEIGAFALAALFAGRLGKASMSAHTIALTYCSLTFCAAISGASESGARLADAKTSAKR